VLYVPEVRRIFPIVEPSRHARTDPEDEVVFRLALGEKVADPRKECLYVGTTFDLHAPSF
jgi:hypothetical protein